MKIIDFLRNSVPSIAGFPDVCTIFSDFGNVTYVTHNARTSPNPYKPSTKAVWDTCYGLTALGVFNGQCVIHNVHGKCILINNGAEIPSALPNMNHNGRHVVSEVFCHSAESDLWSGSAACLTVKLSDWSDFIGHFTVGELVKIQIRGTP